MPSASANSPSPKSALGDHRRRAWPRRRRPALLPSRMTPSSLSIWASSVCASRAPAFAALRAMLQAMAVGTPSSPSRPAKRTPRAAAAAPARCRSVESGMSSNAATSSGARRVFGRIPAVKWAERRSSTSATNLLPRYPSTSSSVPGQDPAQCAPAAPAIAPAREQQHREGQPSRHGKDVLVGERQRAAEDLLREEEAADQRRGEQQRSPGPPAGT